MKHTEYVNSLQIDSLKGVRNLSLKNLSAINLITGPNGSGKSTVLDAVELLSNPKDPLQFIKVAKTSKIPFHYLFDKNEIHPYIRISGELLEKPYYTELGSHENISDTLFRGYHSFGISNDGILTNQTNTINLSFADSNTEKGSDAFINVRRISNLYNSISLEMIANDKVVKEKILTFLSLFDQRFSDIYSPDFQNTYITHETYGNVTADFFSQGIRKILKIAEAMSEFHDGILLIDDFETHLSVQTLYEAVSLVYSLAAKKQIQLFITTHSQETIDEWLDLINFHKELSSCKIIRLKSNGITSSCTEFSAKVAYELRMEKEVDFRYEYPKKGETNERIF